MPNSGLPRLSGGIAKREREAWEKPCTLKSCDGAAFGLIYTLNGPKPICEKHTPQARAEGYTVWERSE